MEYHFDIRTGHRYVADPFGSACEPPPTTARAFLTPRTDTGLLSDRGHRSELIAATERSTSRLVPGTAPPASVHNLCSVLLILKRAVCWVARFCGVSSEVVLYADHLPLCPAGLYGL